MENSSKNVVANELKFGLAESFALNANFAKFQLSDLNRSLAKKIANLPKSLESVLSFEKC